MKLETKEQVMYGMLKGIEQEPAYKHWFELAMKEMFKDSEDQEAWMEELENALRIYENNKVEETTIFDELDDKFESYGQPKLTSQDWIDSLSLLRYETDDEIKMFKLIYRHLSQEEFSELLTDIVKRRESFHNHIINVEGVRYENGVYFFGPKKKKELDAMVNVWDEEMKDIEVKMSAETWIESLIEEGEKNE